MSIGNYFKWFLVSVSMILLTACGGGSSSGGEQNIAIQPTLENQEARIYLPDVNSSNDINVSTLSVISFAEDNIRIADVEGVVQVVDPEDNTIFLSYNIPGVSVSLSPLGSANTVDTKIDFSIRSTAYSLVMMVVSPAIDTSEKSTVSSLILGHTDFAALVEQMTLAYKANPRYLEVLANDINLVDSIQALAKNVLQEYTSSATATKKLSSVPNSEPLIQRSNNVASSDTWMKFGPSAQPQLGLADLGNRLAVINTNTIFWGAEFKSCKNNITKELIVPRVTSYGVSALFSTPEAIKELKIGQDISNETVYMRFYSTNGAEYLNYLQLVSNIMSIFGSNIPIQNVIDSFVEGHLVINNYTECLWKLDGFTNNKQLPEQVIMMSDTLNCFTSAIGGTIGSRIASGTAELVKFFDKALYNHLSWAYKVYQLSTEVAPLALQIEEAKAYGNAYFALTWDGDKVINILNNNVMPSCTNTLETLLKGKTFYQHWKDNTDSWIDTLTFGTDGTLTISNDMGTETMTYTINGSTLTVNSVDFTDTLDFIEVTDTYINLGNDLFYFTAESAWASSPMIDTGSGSGGCSGEMSPEGVCVEFYESGAVWRETPYVNGVTEGIQKEYYETGVLWIETPYVNGVIQGIQKVYYSTGALNSETPYVNGFIQGIRKEYHSSTGTLRIETTYVNSIAEGIQKQYYETGALNSETPYVNGIVEGIRKEYDFSGFLSGETLYVNGVKQIQKEYYSTGVIWRETPYVNDVIQGIQKEYYSTGTLMTETPYMYGIIQGIQKQYYYSTGTLMTETPYVNGDREGIQKEYYETGALMAEIPYVNGVIQGIQKEYYETGTLKVETPYVNDVTEGVKKEYDSTGAIWRETLYANGVIANVIMRTYYETGELWVETPYVNSLKEGIQKIYYETGALMAEIPYVNNVKNGTAYYYLVTGELEYTENFINGVSQSK